MDKISDKSNNTEWKHFSFQNIPDLSDLTTFNQFNSGHIIFYEGHMPYGLFILTSGEVEIKYRKEKIEIIKAPAFLGTFAFKNKKPYAGTATVLIKSSVYFLNTIKFDSLNQRHPVSIWVNKFI